MSTGTLRRWPTTAPWALAGVLMLAFLLRLSHLTDRSLWFDEAFSWRLIQFPFTEFFNRIAADVHPALYYVLLKPWVTLIPDGASSLFWLRLFSVLCSVGAVAAMYAAGRILFHSRFVGLAAALLTAVNAFQVQYAWEARMYALGTLLFPLSLLFLVQTSRAKSVRRGIYPAILLGLTTGAFLHVHYYALLSVTGLGLFSLVWLLRRCSREGVSVLRAPEVLSVIGGLAIALLLFIPWVPVLLPQLQRVEQAFWIPPLTPDAVPETLVRLILGGAEDPPLFAVVLTVIVILTVLLVALVRGRTREDVLLVFATLTPFVGSILVSLQTSIYQDRYFVFASLPLLLLVARSISLFPRKSSVFLLGFATIISGFSVVKLWRDLDFPRHPGAAGAAAYLREHAKPAEPVLVSSSFAYFPMAFHLGCQKPETRNRKLGTGTARGDGGCVNGLAVRLYSENGQLTHFAGGPILVPSDIIGRDVFQLPASSSEPHRLWVVDTSGFGGSRLHVPARYTLTREAAFSELFPFQGEIIVREYVLASLDEAF